MPDFRVFKLVPLVCVLVAGLVSGAVAEPREVMVPMQDGTRLATDVYLPGPEEEGPWPVILVRTTYGRKVNTLDGQLKRGYAIVVQDVRGMFDSEGQEYVFHFDGWRTGYNDGADTVAWIAAQPWCNGKVGSYGPSALAMTQMLMAPTTDALDAQVLLMVPSDYYHEVSYQGGVLRKSLVEGWLAAIGQDHLVPVYKSHAIDDDFWAYYDIVTQARDISSPALFVNGWYDIFQQGTINGFLSREEKGEPGARGNNYLIMSWASHGKDVTTDYTFNKNRFDLKISRVRNAFLDYHLKGDKDALEGIAKVQYYVLGDDTDPGAPGNEWRSANRWPPYPTEETAFYLGPGGALSQAMPAESGEGSFTYDPENPFPTHGGNNLLPGLPAGPFDQRPYSESREDFLAFTTEPLDEPMEITGRCRVELYVSSDAPDTDFTAKLLDIYPEPDGREINVLDNIRRVKTRNGYGAFAPLLEGPGQIVTLEIDLWSTAWVFNKGHRIGLHISSSNHPRFEVNVNTGANHPTKNTERRVAQNKVHFGEAHPSALVLPVRPVE